MQLVEIRQGIDLRVYLREHYVERGWLLRDIAADLGVDIGTVSRWKDHFGLVRQDPPAEVAS
jgi:transposase